MSTAYMKLRSPSNTQQKSECLIYEAINQAKDPVKQKQTLIRATSNIGQKIKLG